MIGWPEMLKHVQQRDVRSVLSWNELLHPRRGLGLAVWQKINEDL